MTLLSTQEIDELFDWVENEPTLQRKAELVLEQYNNTKTEKGLYLSMVTSVFLESFLFYSGFFYPLFLAGQGKMVASGEIISLILRDESLHGKFIGLLAQEIFDKFSQTEKEENKVIVKEIFYKLYKNELEYVSEVYKNSGLEEQVIKFMQFNANTAFTNLGFEKEFDITEIDINPIVLNGLSTETKTHDFFSTKGNGYQKGIYEELTDEDFII